MPPRIPFGSVVEIHTAKGYAYALYTHKHDVPPRYGALLRVFDRIFATRQTAFEWMRTAEPQFNQFFPLGPAVHRKLVSIVAKIDVPPWAEPFPLFRNGNPDPRTKKVAIWSLWDGERRWQVGALTPEQRRISLLGTCNDTLLKERIESGWRPETDPR